jgi:hypothetical protein
LIFAFLDDGTLQVHGSVAAVTGRFEGADVESGAVQFYDETGTFLEPRFSMARRKARFLGWLGWRSAGDAYELHPNPAADPDSFAIALYETITLAPNPWFASMEQLKSELATRGVSVEYQPW